MNIYYACAITGANPENIKNEIKVCQKYGNVLTENIIDEFNKINTQKSNTEMFENDIKKLEKAELIIANVSKSSLGVGFVIGYARENKKPIVCYTNEDINNVSSFIKGGFQVYENRNDLIKFEWMLMITIFSKFIVPNNELRIHFIGPAGCGKSTAAQKLDSNYFSTGKLLREKEKELPENMLKYINSGKLIPAKEMAEFLNNNLNLKNKDYSLFDGYPCSLEDAKEYSLNKKISKIIFLFEVSKETSIKRQTQRGERQTDTPELAKKRYENYMNDLKTFEMWFPGCQIIKINAEKTQSEILNEIIEKFGVWVKPVNIPRVLTIHPNPNESVLGDNYFHMHFDGKNHLQVIKMYIELCEKMGQIFDAKIYGIGQLLMGKQYASKYKDYYSQMNNFHEIKQEKNISEAFLTLSFGKNAPSSLLVDVLNKIIQQNKGSAFELEEEVIVGEILENEVKIENKLCYHSSNKLPFYNELFDKKHTIGVPPLEIHLAADLPKNSEFKLSKIRDELDLNIGGWFVFASPDLIKIRTNEFIDCDVNEAGKIIEDKAKKLRNWLNDNLKIVCNVGFSVEIVHFIVKND